MPNQNDAAANQENPQQVNNLLSGMSTKALISTAPACIERLFPAPALVAICVVGSTAAGFTE